MASHFTFRLEHPEIEKLLNGLRTGARSEYIRQALVFYHSFGSLIEFQSQALREVLAAISKLQATDLKAPQEETKLTPGPADMLEELFIKSLDSFATEGGVDK